MLERLIRLRPSLIVLVYREILGPEKSKYDKLFQIALDNGYKITENDLKRNKDFCKSEFVMKKAIEINPNYIRYYEGNNSSLVNEAVDRGYIPNITDLENNNLLGSSNIINYLISHGHPEAIKYARSVYGINIDQALKEYTPTFEDLKNNKSLGSIEQIMSIILEEDVNAIRLIGYSMSKDERERLIKYAVENGFKPSVEDVVKDGMENPLSGSDLIFEKLLKDDCNNIKYYTGRNQNIYKMALNFGYNPNINDLKKNHDLYWSDDIMSELIKNDPSLILEYKGNNEKVAILSYNLGFKEDKILENINNILDDHIFFYSGFIMEKLVA